jgi:hypothetical protein
MPPLKGYVEVAENFDVDQLIFEVRHLVCIAAGAMRRWLSLIWARCTDSTENLMKPIASISASIATVALAFTLAGGRLCDQRS